LRIGLRHGLSERWSLLAAATWTGWHSFDAIRVDFEDGRPRFVETEDWRDVWRAGIGAEYRASAQWTLRAGFEYDQSPIPQSTMRPRIPERDPRWLSIGASWQPHPGSGPIVDLAYSYILVGDYRVDVAEATTPWLSGGALPGNRLSADYSTHANALSLGLRWPF
jgi:long-chain fatty acid transport protein